MLQEKAVAPAAESVTREEDDLVLEDPTKIVSRGSFVSYGKLLTT